jgi:hypothetical protein
MMVTFTDDSKEIKRFHNDGSYLSGNDPRILLKWQMDKQVKQVEITWPTGEKSQYHHFLYNQYQQVDNNGS